MDLSGKARRLDRSGPKADAAPRAIEETHGQKIEFRLGHEEEKDRPGEGRKEATAVFSLASPSPLDSC